MDPVIAGLIEKVAALLYRVDTLEKATDYNATQTMRQFEAVKEQQRTDKEQVDRALAGLRTQVEGLGTAGG